MTRVHLLLASVLVVLVAAEAAKRSPPRVLRPHKSALLNAGRAAASEDCNSSLKSCDSCTSVLSCTKLGNVYRPLQTSECPPSTPYCSNGACVANLANDDPCLLPPAPVTDFTCNGNGYFPSPSDCRKYYLCVDQEPYESTCNSARNLVYSHEKAMCVPSTEATCSTVACTNALIGAYQPWRADRSVYFVCTDNQAAHAYVADCGADKQIDAATSECVMACLREGRLPDDTDAKKFYECTRTSSTTFSAPVPGTCPGNSTFDTATERCVVVSSGGGGGGGSTDPYAATETYFAPDPDVPEDTYDIPKGFLLGSASAAYQIEGAWNASDKSESIWDVFFHSRPDMPNGDIACDSYDQWEKDVGLLQELGMNMYRFSISWTRLLPSGDQAGQPSTDGLNYYLKLIDALIAANIEPVITLHHWDIPQKYQNDGGWLNSAIQDRFVDFADFAFQAFGEKVKRWILMNEPHIFCLSGYEGTAFAPAVGQTGTGGYECVHNMILAHAKAYHHYKNNYAYQNGTIGTSLDLQYAQPYSSSPEDKEAAERQNIFTFAWFADPITTGDYPKLMRDIIDRNSAAAGTPSRLPTFTADERVLIKGTWDFIGLNHYSTSLVRNGAGTPATAASYNNDTNTLSSSRDTWYHEARGVFSVCPWGFRGVLNWIKDRYNNIPVLVTESGYADSESQGTNDAGRKGYYSTYMRAMLRAMKDDGCNVIGYTAWCLEDNLEWNSGYSTKFGLAHVDFNDPERKRTLKDSASLFKEVARTQRVNYYEPVQYTPS